MKSIRLAYSKLLKNDPALPTHKLSAKGYTHYENLKKFMEMLKVSNISQIPSEVLDNAKQAAHYFHDCAATENRQQALRRHMAIMDTELAKRNNLGKSEEADRETLKIRENKKKPENKMSHKFKAAEWTHPNGHPRCIRCGQEERIGGTCQPLGKSEQFSYRKRLRKMITQPAMPLAINPLPINPGV